MKIQNKKIILLVCLFAAGCAHSSPEKLANEKLDEKLAQEPAIQTRKNLRKEVDDLIQTAPGLSSAQRAKLGALRDATRKQADILREKSLKLRAVLVEDLLSGKWNSKEVEQVKIDIQNTEQERVKLLMNTVKQTNWIFGRSGSRTERQEDRLVDHQMLFDLTDIYWN